MTPPRPRILLSALAVAGLTIVIGVSAATTAVPSFAVTGWLSLGAVALAAATTGVLLVQSSRAVLAAGALAGVWTIGAALCAVIAFANAPLSGEPTLDFFLLHTVPGRSWLISGIAGLSCSILCLTFRHRAARGAAIAMSVVGMIALGSVGAALPLSDGSAARIRTGRELPEAPTPGTWVTLWELDAVTLALIVALAATCVWSTARARRDGVLSRHELLMRGWGIVGLLLAVWLTQGALERYQGVLFSAHLLQMLGALCIVGPLLSWGRVVSWGRMGGALLAGRAVWVALAVAASLWGYLFSPLMRWALADPTVHTVMLVWFAGLGGAMVVAIRSSPRASRISASAIALAAVIGVAAALHFGNTVLVAEWFGGLGRMWSADALADQRASAVLVWVFGVAPGVLFWALPAGILSGAPQLSARQPR